MPCLPEFIKRFNKSTSDKEIEKALSDFFSTDGSVERVSRYLVMEKPSYRMFVVEFASQLKAQEQFYKKCNEDISCRLFANNSISVRIFNEISTRPSE